MDNKNMTDKELDRILAAASQPQLPSGFAVRLQAKLEAETANNVIPFPSRNTKPVPSRRIWLSAIPLVASLAAGIYIGALGHIPTSLQTLDSTAVSDASDQTMGSGFEDTEAFVNGDLS